MLWAALSGKKISHDLFYLTKKNAFKLVITRDGGFINKSLKNRYLSIYRNTDIIDNR